MADHEKDNTESIVPTANDMDEILPGVFLGGQRAAENKVLLKSHGIQRILNVTC
mgnify:CR=1 FL=1